MSRLARLLAVGLALVAAAAHAEPAGAATGTPLAALSGAGYMVVDEAHGHVFVTGAPPRQPWDGTGANSAIVVMNADGTTAATITGEAGAAGMVISNGTLYVARCGTTVIDEFSTATLTKIGTLTVANPMLYPCDVAITGGRIWFDSQWPNVQVGSLTSLTLASPHVAAQLETLDGPSFAVNPANPNMLLIGSTYGRPAWYTV